MPKFVIAVPQVRYFRVAAKTPDEALEKFSSLKRPRKAALSAEYEQPYVPAEHNAAVRGA